jgi:aminopeptidase N
MTENQFQPSPTEGSFAYGSSATTSRAKPLLLVGLVLILVVATLEGFLLVSANQAKRAAVASQETASKSLNDAQAQVASMEAEIASAESQAQNLQSQYDALKASAEASAWKAAAYTKMNACMDAIIAAYNAVTYEQELGPAMNNTFHNGDCERVLSFADKNY